MQINVTFRHTDPKEDLKKYAENKIKKLLRILDRPQEIHITLSKEKIRHIAEVTIAADGFNETVKESQSDFFTAIDKVTDKIERKLKKEKDRRKTRKTSKGLRIKTRQITELPPILKLGKHEKEEEEADAPAIVQSNLFLAKPMTVEDAAIELTSKRSPLVVFRNAATMEICVLHTNKDGSLGLVEPSDR